MRLLSKKVAKSVQKHDKKHSLPFESLLQLNDVFDEDDTQEKEKMAKLLLSGKLTCKKVIVRNYCKALVNFSISEHASGYLLEDLNRGGVDLGTFRNALKAKKDTINTFQDLEQLLWIRPDDSVQLICFRMSFKNACIIFLKYFSVSWILNAHFKNRSLYLSYKGKFIQHIQKIGR